MDDQKRLLLAVLLSVVVLVGYQFFFVTPPPDPNPSQTARESSGTEPIPSPENTRSAVSDYTPDKNRHRPPSTGPNRRISEPFPFQRRCMTLIYLNIWLQ